MSTDVEQREPDGGEVVDAPEAAPAERVADPEALRRREAMRSRVVLPLLLPIVSIGVVAFYALNLSRVFLAGKGAPAVITATLITIAILGGAAYISMKPGLRTSSLVLTVSLVLVLVLSAGLVTLGASDEKKEGGTGSAAPTGPAVGTLQVEALAALKFQATEFTVPAGINEIEYVDKGGTHTLVFTDPKLSFFELKVPQGPTKGKAELEAGKDYVIYCTIAGHREAGMEATVKVTAGPAPAPAPPGGAPAGGAETTTTTAAS